MAMIYENEHEAPFRRRRKLDLLMKKKQNTGLIDVKVTIKTLNLRYLHLISIKGNVSKQDR